MLVENKNLSSTDGFYLLFAYFQRKGEARSLSSLQHVLTFRTAV